MFQIKHPLPPTVVASTSTRDKDHISLPYVSLNQEHQDKVVLIENYPAVKPQADAMITKKEKLPLLMRHADCQIAVFYDPVQHALGMAHSGWRGSILNIYAKTIVSMREQFGTNPQDVVVTISPSLSPEKSEFVHYKSELPERMWDYQFQENHFDFWAISHDQLTEAGIPSNQINNLNLCTLSNPQLFHSYRRDKTAKRNFTVAMLSSAEEGDNLL